MEVVATKPKKGSKDRSKTSRPIKRKSSAFKMSSISVQKPNTYRLVRSLIAYCAPRFPISTDFRRLWARRPFHSTLIVEATIFSTVRLRG